MRENDNGSRPKVPGRSADGCVSVWKYQSHPPIHAIRLHLLVAPIVALLAAACTLGAEPRETVELVASVFPPDSGKVELDGNAASSDDDPWASFWEGNVSGTSGFQTITSTSTLAPFPTPFLKFRANPTRSEQPLLARPDDYSLDEDETLDVERESGILANDRDVDGNPLEATLVDVPRHGMLKLDPDGSFTYTPNEDFSGVDSFTYTASDAVLTSGRATVSITVVAVDDPPVAQPDAYAVDEDEVLDVAYESGILVNDRDVDGNPLEARLVEGPRHGSLSLNADGSFIYTPKADFSGVDSFTYAARAGGLISPTSEVSISVSAVSHPPVVQLDSYGVDEDEVLDVRYEGGVLANDRDVDGNPLEATLIDGPRYGTLALDPDGSFTYVPNADFSGADFFTYRASDGPLDPGALVNITVRPMNDAPEAVHDSFAVAEDGVLRRDHEAGVLANDIDIDADPIEALLIENPSNGTLVLRSDGSFQYTPDADFNGTDSFRYQATDHSLSSGDAVVTINVEPLQDRPAARSESYTVREDKRLRVSARRGVLANDSDADGDRLTAKLTRVASNGFLLLNPDGSFQYTPRGDFYGDDWFTYQATDGWSATKDTSVFITVSPVNDRPAAIIDIYTASENVTLSVDRDSGVLANDYDVDSEFFQAILKERPSHGSLTLAWDGSFTYLPDPGFTGSDSFEYCASDLTLCSNRGIVFITVSPAP